MTTELTTNLDPPTMEEIHAALKDKVSKRAQMERDKKRAKGSKAAYEEASSYLDSLCADPKDSAPLFNQDAEDDE